MAGVTGVISRGVSQLPGGQSGGAAAPRWGGRAIGSCWARTAGRPPLTLGLVVGREDEVETPVQGCKQAVQGSRQLVLVTGDAEIGKTTGVARCWPVAARGVGCGSLVGTRTGWHAWLGQSA
jgi:hypothetical protein